MYLADVKADKFLLPHHSSKVWGTAAVSTKKIGNFWAKPGSCMQTKACDSWRQSICLSFIPNFFTYPCYCFPHFSTKTSFEFELTELETLFQSKKSTGGQLSPHRSPGYSEQKQTHWKSIVAVTGDSSEAPFKNKIKKKRKTKTERTPLYLLCCVCSTAIASLCHQKERIYELHLASPKSYESNA